MDAKRFLTGSVVGGVVLMATGYAIFNIAFASFYAANAGSATGVDRTPQIIWAMAVANLAYAALVTYTMGQRSGSTSVSGGAMIGAVVGCLIWATADFVLFGSTNIANLTRTIVDPLLEIIHGGLGGAAIALVAGRGKGGAGA